jgi:hypothetical protein
MNTFGIHVTSRVEVAKILKKQERATVRSLGHAGALIRMTARRSLRKRKPDRHAPPGQPPYSHAAPGEFWGLRNAILYEVLRHENNVLVGPVFSRAERIAWVHEHGGVLHNRRSWKAIHLMARRHGWTREQARQQKRRPVPMRYPKRPFMGPALLQIQDRLPKFWAGTITE